MARFCGNCGSKLDEKTGVCPKCNVKKIQKRGKSLNKKETRKKRRADKKAAKKKRIKEKKQLKKLKKKEKWVEMTFGKKVRHIFLKFALSMFIISVVAGGTLGSLNYWGLINVPYINSILHRIGLESKSTKAGNEMDSHTVTAPDAEKYYSDNSEIISEIDVVDSTNVYTEKETCSIFEKRNFVEYTITTEYSMEGVYSSAIDISSDSDKKHPIYQTYYYSENEELWTIYLINGKIMANPVSYNIQSDLNVQVIISEDNTVTSYDSTTNKFYETIPSQSALIVITVDKINAETLDKLTIGEIDRHV